MEYPTKALHENKVAGTNNDVLIISLHVRLIGIIWIFFLPFITNTEML